VFWKSVFIRAGRPNQRTALGKWLAKALAKEQINRSV